jgi:hypothetical protein
LLIVDDDAFTDFPLAVMSRPDPREQIKIPEGLKHSGIETYGLCRLNQHDHVLPERNVRRRRAGRLFGLAVVFDEYICFASNFTLSRLHLVE